MKPALIFSLVTSASAAAINARANPELTLGAHPAPTSDLAVEGEQAIDPALTLGGLHPAPSSEIAAERKKTINPALTLTGARPAPTSDLAVEEEQAIDPALTLGGARPAPTSEIAGQGKNVDSPAISDIFTLRVVSHDRNINNQNLTAARHFMRLHEKPKTDCNRGDAPSYAYFYFKGDRLMLYSDAEDQKVEYFACSAPLIFLDITAENKDLKSPARWSLDHNNHLTLGGKGFRLCRGRGMGVITNDRQWWVHGEWCDPREIQEDDNVARYASDFCTTDFVLEAVPVKDAPSCKYLRPAS